MLTLTQPGLQRRAAKVGDTRLQHHRPQGPDPEPHQHRVALASARASSRGLQRRARETPPRQLDLSTRGGYPAKCTLARSL
jgi:hypothetical protein